MSGGRTTQKPDASRPSSDVRRQDLFRTRIWYLFLLVDRRARSRLAARCGNNHRLSHVCPPKRSNSKVNLTLNTCNSTRVPSLPIRILASEFKSRGSRVENVEATHASGAQKRYRALGTISRMSEMQRWTRLATTHACLTDSAIPNSLQVPDYWYAQGVLALLFSPLPRYLHVV
ncbi:hypothetical protein IQ07DRAFT_603856 [Pyrenochaeta sp. DS3sAY3a]|nr:hypothetical protein IQ07DRAFT_603856 [Pyrenochaeta sp. DS3sAY3a]